MRQRALRMLGAAALCLLVPITASAQTSTIAGEVKDTSGAVLPGVTVEVASPALIEQVRSAVTDGSGKYAIVQLRPGTYTSPSPSPASTSPNAKTSSSPPTSRRRSTPR